METEKLEQKWGELEYAPVAGYLREAVDVIKNASLVERVAIKKQVSKILTSEEILELKDFFDQLD